MTQEDKQLLLRDLCARLPYGVKVAIEYSKGKYTHIYDLREIDNDATSELRQQVTVWNYGFYSSVISYPLIDCRPYLRPMSSMTEKELFEVQDIIGKGVEICDGFIDIVDSSITSLTYAEIQAVFDWFLKNHFDLMSLIPKGLAIEVTKENNPYKLLQVTL